MDTNNIDKTFSVEEASRITAVPCKWVHRIIDAELLGRVAGSDKRCRSVREHELLRLRLAYETCQKGETRPLNANRRRRIKKLLNDLDLATISTRRNRHMFDVERVREEVNNGHLLMILDQKMEAHRGHCRKGLLST